MGDTKPYIKISLVTFNTLGTPFFAPDITKRYREIAQLINNGPYDIVCLQEVFTYYHFFLLKKNLPFFPYVAYKKNLSGPKGGLVIFSKLPFSNKEFIAYSYPTNGYVPFYTKIAQHGILSIKIASSPLRICTTHLSSDIVHDLSPKNKLYSLVKHQSEEVAKIINDYTKKGEQLIIMGDFNIAKHSSLYKEFLKNAHVTDVFADDEQPTYYPDRINYFYRSPAGRIDYIFSKNFRRTASFQNIMSIFKDKVTFSKKKNAYLSDHIGLHCTLEANK